MTISGHSQVAEMLAPFHGGHYSRQVIQLSLTISGHSHVAEMLAPFHGGHYSRQVHKAVLMCKCASFKWQCYEIFWQLFSIIELIWASDKHVKMVFLKNTFSRWLTLRGVRRLNFKKIQNWLTLHGVGFCAG